MQAVVERCLAPDPDDRYQSAAELTADLQAVADDLPLAYAREPFWSRFARRLRRTPRPVPAVAPDPPVPSSSPPQEAASRMGRAQAERSRTALRVGLRMGTSGWSEKKSTPRVRVRPPGVKRRPGRRVLAMDFYRRIKGYGDPGDPGAAGRLHSRFGASRSGSCAGRGNEPTRGGSRDAGALAEDAMRMLDEHLEREPFLVRISAAKRLRDVAERGTRQAGEDRVTVERLVQALAERLPA